MVKNRNFMSKIEILVKNRNFMSKIEKLVKNRNFRQKSKFDQYIIHKWLINDLQISNSPNFTVT